MSVWGSLEILRTWFWGFWVRPRGLQVTMNQKSLKINPNCFKKDCFGVFLDSSFPKTIFLHPESLKSNTVNHTDPQTPMCTLGTKCWWRFKGCFCPLLGHILLKIHAAGIFWFSLFSLMHPKWACSQQATSFTFFYEIFSFFWTSVILGCKESWENCPLCL